MPDEVAAIHCLVVPGCASAWDQQTGDKQALDALVEMGSNVGRQRHGFRTQALLPLIADGGAIVNVSSGLTRIINPGHAAYAAMKGAIEVLTRYQAKELGGRGIRVNVVAPGATRPTSAAE